MVLLKHFLKASCIFLLAAPLQAAPPDMRDAVKNAMEASGLTKEKFEQIQKSKPTSPKQGQKDPPVKYEAVPLSAQQQIGFEKALRAVQEKHKKSIASFLKTPPVLLPSEEKTLKEKGVFLDPDKQLAPVLSLYRKLYPEVNSLYLSQLVPGRRPDTFEFLLSLHPDSDVTLFYATLAGKYWNYFLAKNMNANHFMEYRNIPFENDKKLPDMQINKQLPDYTQELAGAKFVVIGENCSHGNRAQIDENTRVLRELRQANPKARILLAQEHANSVLICEQPLDKCNWPLPFRRANTSNEDIVMVEEYQTAVIPLLDKLHIDLLALDNIYIGGSAIKIGDKAIPVLPQELLEGTELQGIDDGVSSKVAQTYISHYLADGSFESLQDFIYRSTWGAVQRNRQWMDYIRAAEPFYDIIVVWGGSFHTAYGPHPITDDITLLGEKTVYVETNNTATNDEFSLDYLYASLEELQQYFGIAPKNDAKEEFLPLNTSAFVKSIAKEAESLALRDKAFFVSEEDHKNHITSLFVFIPPAEIFGSNRAQLWRQQLFTHQGFIFPTPQVDKNK